MDALGLAVTSDELVDVIRGALHARTCSAVRCGPDCDGPSDHDDADAEAVVAALRWHGLVA